MQVLSMMIFDEGDDEDCPCNSNITIVAGELECKNFKNGGIWGVKCESLEDIWGRVEVKRHFYDFFSIFEAEFVINCVICKLNLYLVVL